ncbi:hypothetical protein LA080_016288 [Diaporthe eres]|nr:hypothetical protein LA080_016288 [Diaporthe eres]
MEKQAEHKLLSGAKSVAHIGWKEGLLPNINKVIAEVTRVGIVVIMQTGAQVTVGKVEYNWEKIAIEFGPMRLPKPRPQTWRDPAMCGLQNHEKSHIVRLSNPAGDPSVMMETNPMTTIHPPPTGLTISNSPALIRNTSLDEPSVAIEPALEEKDTGAHFVRLPDYYVARAGVSRRPVEREQVTSSTYCDFFNLYDRPWRSRHCPVEILIMEAASRNGHHKKERVIFRTPPQIHSEETRSSFSGGERLAAATCGGVRTPPGENIRGRARRAGARSPRHWPRASGTTPAENSGTSAPATGGGAPVRAASMGDVFFGVIGAVALF